MQNKNIIKKNAFTLLELSIVIIMLGMITIAGISFQVSMMDNSQKNITMDKLNRIEQAIKEYILEKGKLPCPANITLRDNDVNYGTELRSSDDNCFATPSGHLNNNIIYGSVPTKTLGLTSDYGIDSWKNQIPYIINKNYAKRSTFLNTSSNAITIKNLKNDIITDKVIYFLFSPGINKNGAFRNGNQNSINSSLDDDENAYKSGFNNIFIKDIINDKFDDIIIYKEKNDILLEADLEDIFCSLEDLKNTDNKWNYTSHVDCNNNSCQQGLEIISKDICPSSYISKNPILNTLDNSFKPVRKCLKYGKWSDIIYPCISGCGESNIYNITGGTFQSSGLLRSTINLNYLKRVESNEEVTLQCINNNMTGYVTLKCQANGTWTYISDSCVYKNKILN